MNSTEWRWKCAQSMQKDNAGVRIKLRLMCEEKGDMFAFTHREASARYPGLPNLLKYKTHTFYHAVI